MQIPFHFMAFRFYFIFSVSRVFYEFYMRKLFANFSTRVGEIRADAREIDF